MPFTPVARLLAGVTVACGLAVLHPVAAGAVTFKVSSCLPTNDVQVQAFLETFVKPFNAAAKGRVTLNYIGGPEVTPRTKQAQALQRGLLDLILCPGAYYSGQVPEVKLIPVGNVPMAEMRRNGALDMLQAAWGTKLNARFLAYCASESPFNLYLVDKPKLRADGTPDISGLRMRSTSLYNPLFKAMGAIPVAMAGQEIYTGLQRGVVKGFGWPETSVAALGVKDLVKYKIKPGFMRGTTFVIVNLEKYKSLPKDMQALLDKTGADFDSASVAYLKPHVDKDIATLKKAGMRDLNLSGEGAKKYLRTIYNAAWKDTERGKYSVDYAKLKSLIYRE